MPLELVYNNAEPTVLHLPKRVLPDSGIPYEHHFKGTPQDNLIELAGRVCYESAKSPSTRGSEAYHQHINEVNHGSVQEHVNFTIPIYKTEMIHFINRPGVWISYLTEDLIFATMNIRAAREWAKWCTIPIPRNPDLEAKVKNSAEALCPLAMSAKPKEPFWEYTTQLAKPMGERETFLSFYIYDVSRGLTHEQVRHRLQCGISQRSTRYVDESESDWSWHPLILKYADQLQSSIPESLNFNSIELNSQLNYDECVDKLQKVLLAAGLDKFTARKQARGAARGILGNALSTELIWTASVAEIREVIRQRATAAADAEIRLLANQLYEVVTNKFPSWFKGSTTAPCADGIGYEVTLNG